MVQLLLDFCCYAAGAARRESLRPQYVRKVPFSWKDSTSRGNKALEDCSGFEIRFRYEVDQKQEDLPSKVKLM